MFFNLGRSSGPEFRWEGEDGWGWAPALTKPGLGSVWGWLQTFLLPWSFVVQLGPSEVE